MKIFNRLTFLYFISIASCSAMDLERLNTQLIDAAARNYWDTVVYLLKEGAHYSILTAEQLEPLHGYIAAELQAAIIIQDMDAIARLKAINQEVVNEQLFQAAMQRDLVRMQEVIERGADIHSWKNRILIGTALEGYLEVVQYLVEHGADIHARNDQALRLAATYGHFSVVRYLIKQGGDIHEIGILQGAASHGQWDIVVCLLQHGADRMQLTIEQLEQLYCFKPECLIVELQALIAQHKWHMVEQILNVVSLSRLPEDAQNQIGRLVAPAVLMQKVRLKK